MILVSLRRGFENGEEIVKLEISDGRRFTVKSCYLDGYGFDLDSWEAERELSSAETEALGYAHSCLKAERAAMRLIARAEQRKWALTAKLKRKGFDSACINAVIQRFLELNLLNDRRFAEIWLRSRLAKHGGNVPGPKYLRAMLQNRGIDRETAASALETVLDEEAEWALLERFAKKKDLPAGGSLLRRKLREEGFSPEVLERFFDG